MRWHKGLLGKSLKIAEYALTLILGLQLCVALPGAALAEDAPGPVLALGGDALAPGWLKKGLEECFDPYHFGLFPDYDAAHAALNPLVRRYFWNVPVGGPMDDSFLMLSSAPGRYSGGWRVTHVWCGSTSVPARASPGGAPPGQIYRLHSNGVFGTRPGMFLAGKGGGSGNAGPAAVAVTCLG